MNSFPNAVLFGFQQGNRVSLGLAKLPSPPLLLGTSCMACQVKGLSLWSLARHTQGQMEAEKQGVERTNWRILFSWQYLLIVSRLRSLNKLLDHFSYISVKRFKRKKNKNRIIPIFYHC